MSTTRPTLRDAVKMREQELLSMEAEFHESFNNLDFNHMVSFFKNHILAQDEGVTSALLNIYAYLSAMDRGQPNAFNFILAGPSGCGKTEFFRTLEKYMKNNMPTVKVLVKDASTLTAEGFKGADKDFIVRGVNPGDYAIIYLDEFDKLMTPKHTSNGDNVSIEIQSGILQMVEGNKVAMGNSSRPDIDTSKILFIGGGAFEGIHRFQKMVSVENKSDEVTLGYQKPVLKKRIDVTHGDIVAWGGLPELVGRFCNIINFHALPQDVMRDLVNLRIKEFEYLYDYPIFVTDQFCHEILSATDDKFGSRIIRSKIWEALKTTIVRAKDPGVLSLTLDWDGKKFFTTFLESDTEEYAS